MAAHAVRVVVDMVGVMIAGGVGPVLRNTYGGLGLRDRPPGNAVLPGLRSPLKARLRLPIALALGCSPREVFPT